MLSQPTTLPTDRSGGMAGGFVVGWELSVPASSPAPREEKVPPIVRGAFLVATGEDDRDHDHMHP